MKPILRPFRKEDVPAIVQMWRESTVAWPGESDDPNRITEDKIRRDCVENEHLSLNLIELGDRIVGYCDVMQAESEPEFSYVALLNVSPDCHGKSFGRMLLQQAVQDAIDAGQRMIDLGTWPSNMKAVPLYKKTGFLWVPDTNVHMENYIPQIVNMPLTREFFARNDWYATHARELNQDQDREKWHGKEVFSYRWEARGDAENLADSESISVIVDRQAYGVTAFENDDFSIKAYTGVKQVPAGIPHTITWEIVNKRTEPLSLSLLARSEDASLKIDKQEQVVVDSSTTITAPFSIDTDFEPKNGRVESFVIRTDIVVNGTPLMLRTSTEQWQAVTLGMEFFTSVEKGIPVEGVVRIQNDMDRAWEGTVHIQPDPRVRIEMPDSAFRVEPESKTGVPVTLELLEDDLVELKLYASVQHESGTVTTNPATHVIKNCPLGELRTHQNPVCITLVSNPVAMNISLKGGDIDVEQSSMWWEPVAVGPPYPVIWMNRGLREGRIERTPDSVTAVVTLKDEKYTGLIIESRVTLHADGRVYTQERFCNSGSVKHEFTAKSGGGFGRMENRRAIVPLAEGIVESHLASWDGFPSQGDLPDDASIFSEEWIAMQADGMVSGIVWQEQNLDSIKVNNWGISFQRCIQIEPGIVIDSPPTHLIVGGGDWKTVRRLWQRTYGGGVPHEERTPETRNPVATLTEPSPVIATGQDATADLVVQSSSMVPRTQKLALTPPEGWTVSPTQTEATYKRDEPSSTPLSLSIPGDKPTAGIVKVVRTGIVRDYHADLPVIRTGDGSNVAVTESDGIVTIDNGLMTAKASADFNGSIHSVVIDGAELVRSEYPEAGNLGWMRPWFGGIHAYTGAYPGFLHESAYTSELVERRGSTSRTGRTGLVWKGVRIVNTPDHKELRDRRIEVEYLTTGGSNIIAVLTRAVNLYPVPLNVSLGVVADVLPGVGENVQTFADEETVRTDHAPRNASFESDGYSFAGAYDPETGRTAIVVPSSAIPTVKVRSMEAEAVLLNTIGRKYLPHQGDVFEGLSWIIFADNNECAQAYAGLRALEQLP
jgi:ribosomal protein S18 acetylase RimI-like enzyme